VIGYRKGNEPWRVRPSILGLLFLTVAVWFGCHDSTEPGLPAAVRIEPAQGLSLLPGESFQLHAVATDARGSPLPLTKFVWTSKDESIATVTSTGTVTAQAPGATQINVSVGDISGETSLSVPVPVARVALEPAAPSIPVGRTLQLLATVEAEDGTPIVDQPVSWESSDPDVALVSPTGLLTPISPGTATISASCGGKTASVPVVVLAPVAALQVLPGGIRLHPGDRRQLTVTLTDGEGNPLDGRSIHWSSADSGVATVSASGLVLARRLGKAFIRAAAEGEQDSALVEVQAPVSSVKVSPDRRTLGPGETVQLEATPKDANGRTLAGREVVWKSSAEDIAAVSATGLVTALRSGEATITASSEGRAGRAAILVQKPVASVAVRPASKELTVGEEYQLEAILRSADGEILRGRAIHWSSEHSDVASVSSRGGVRARSPGTASIEAESEGVDGGATIRVTRPADVPVVFVGAGDIATCPGNGDEATAQLLDNIPGTVFTAGDNVYSSGSEAEYANCYEPTWGRHKHRTRPIPGNHDYETPSAAGYFNYFGAVAGDRATGYYSYDLGSWHVLALNTQFSGRSGTPQAEWVKADLAAHQSHCTLALWHMPLFAVDSASDKMKNIFQMLYDAGAEIVINGHEHNYERFAPQTAEAVLDPDRGIRQFIVGTGGRSVGGNPRRPANSEVFYKGGFGVLKLTLYSDSYDWAFIPVKGGTFTDRGSARCHQ
jgi:uncharacterized protein YjdB